MDGDDLVDTSFLRPVDVQRLADDLKVDAKASNRSNLNSAERHTADASFLLDISNLLNGRRQTAEQDVWKRVDTIQQLMMSQAARVNFAKCKNESEADLNDMRVLLRKEEGELAERSAFYHQELKSFEEYRFKRRLAGPAKPAKSGITSFMDLTVIWFLEGAINMYFFKVGEKSGALGGLILALLISAVNIGVCLAVGLYVTKLKNSVSIPLKVIGIVGSVAFLPLLVFGHYCIAQYRAQEQIAAEAKQLLTATQYWAGMIQYIKQHPFEFTDLVSLLLFLISLGFGLYAWHKGYDHGDAYPGYTKRYKDYRTHREHFEVMQNYLLDGLVSTRDRIVQRISEFIDDVGPSLIAMEQNASTASVLIGHLRAFRESCDQAQMLLLNRYYAAEGGAPPELISQTANLLTDEAIKQRFEVLLDTMRKSLGLAQDSARGATSEADQYRRMAIDEINSVIGRLDKLKATNDALPA